MRNLKRVLSLALASVMLLGMMVIGAGAADKTAADLTDMDKVTNTEAVTLMVDLGIIVGKPDGSYAPTEGVDRATMAKLITYILMGDVDASIFEGTSTDLTDIDTSWAEGYIKYCYSNGIISGDGQGHFFPTQGVTVVQAAKMLLVALGYDADNRGYQNNPNWSVNIMKDAQTTGLMEGVAGKATDTLTRDGAAQMIFNALFANTVEPTYQYDMGEQYITSYTPKASLATTMYNGLTRNTGVITGNSKATLVTDTIAKGETAVAGQTSDVKLDSSVKMLGHEVCWYTNNGGLVSTAFVETGKTVTTATTFSTDKAYTEFTKGMKIASNAYSSNYGVATTTAFSSANTSAGDTITFIDSTADGTYDYAVKVAYTFGQVLATVDNADETKATVSITGIGTKKLSEIECDTTLVKGDYVLTAVIGGTVYVEKAPSFTGTVTSYTTDKLYVNGTAYTMGAAPSSVSTSASNVYTGTEYKATFTSADSVKKATEATFYTDKGGVVLLVVGKAAETTTAKYGVLLGVKTEYTDEWDTSKTTKFVRMLLSDGTNEVYELDTTGTDVTTSDLLEVYPYTVNDKGQIKLGTVAAAEGQKIELTKGNAAYEVNDAVVTDSYLNASTVVLFYSVDSEGKETVSTFTGVANIPNTVSTNAKNVIVKDSETKTVEFIFINAVADTSVASEAVYAYCDDVTTTTTADGTTANLIVNGETKTLVLDSASVSALEKGYYYTVTTKDGVSTLTGKTALPTAYKVLDVTDTYVVVDKSGVPTTYSFADGYTVDDLSNLNDDGAIIPATGVINKDAVVSLVLNSSNKVVKAYVGQNPSVSDITVTKGEDSKYTAEAVAVSGGVATYAWAVDDSGSVGTADEATTTLTEGTYTVTVTVTGNTGYTVTLTRNVAVDSNGDVTVTTPEA